MFPKQKTTAHQKNLFPLPLTGFSRLTIGLIFLGFLAGYIGAHFLENYIHSTVISLFRDTINQLPWLSIDRNEIFLLSFKYHLYRFFPGTAVLLLHDKLWSRRYTAIFLLFTSTGNFIGTCISLNPKPTRAISL